MKISDNFKLLHITATQMIAYYSVNFDLIQKSFKRLSYHWIVLAKNFNAIALVIELVAKCG